LNVVPVVLPPLRERKEDIPLLIEHFLAKYSKNMVRISPEALSLLINYHWKGNVRELENIIERLVLLCEKDILMPEDVPDDIRRHRDDAACLPEIGEGNVDLEKILEKIEKEYLCRALEMTHGMKTEAAAKLGLTFRSFRHRLHKYGISRS
jgi:two-component system response regulator PilR (NtrC family)